MSLGSSVLDGSIFLAINITNVITLDIIKMNDVSKVVKTVLISFLVSLNVCVWKDIMGDAFYKAGFAVSAFVMGIILWSKAYESRRKL